MFPLNIGRNFQGFSVLSPRATFSPLLVVFAKIEQPCKIDHRKN